MTALDPRAHYKTRLSNRDTIVRALAVSPGKATPPTDIKLLTFLCYWGYGSVAFGQQNAREWDRMVSWRIDVSERSVRESRIRLVTQQALEDVPDRRNPYNLHMTEELLDWAQSTVYRSSVRASLGRERAANVESGVAFCRALLELTSHDVDKDDVMDELYKAWLVDPETAVETVKDARTHRIVKLIAARDRAFDEELDRQTARTMAGWQ